MFNSEQNTQSVSVRGPCWRVLVTVQHNAIAALAPKASLPLLPNLTKLAWSELKMSNRVDPSVSLLKYFCRPRRDLYLALPNLLAQSCPLRTRRAPYSVPASPPSPCSSRVPRTAIGPTKLETSSDNGHTSSSCAAVHSQQIMDILTSRQTLDTLSIELNNPSTALYVDQLPSQVHTWSLDGNSAALCLRYLETIQCSPTGWRMFPRRGHSRVSGQCWRCYGRVGSWRHCGLCLMGLWGCRPRTTRGGDGELGEVQRKDGMEMKMNEG